MSNAQVYTKEAEDIFSGCTCLGKKLFCITSYIALTCANYLVQLCSESKPLSNFNVDLTLTLEDKQFVSHIIDFIISFGLIKNTIYQISPLVPLPEYSKCAEETLFGCCRYLISLEIFF